MVIFFLLLIVFVIPGCYVFGASLSKTETNFSFALPFYATQSEPCPRYPEGLCLADSGPFCHDKVALVSQGRVCNARISFKFPYSHPGGADFEAWALEIPANCGGHVAIIGVDADAIRPIPLEEDQSSVPKDMESKARGLLKDWIMTSSEANQFGDIDQNPLSTSPPKVLKAGQVTMLKFELNEQQASKEVRGPVVLSFKNQLFRLEGWCTNNHLFFSVNDKLHLAYTLYCCGCGLRIVYVYDLSGQTPRQVYENSKLSD